uniref:Uncharacterized protein n=1 Tax=Oryza glumipatula TaxID=40148 RepID=A0A0D9ZPS6_9ORYZ
MGAKLQTHDEENGNIEYLNCTWPDKNHGHSLFCGVLARFQSASCNRKAAPPAVGDPPLSLPRVSARICGTVNTDVGDPLSWS